MIKGVDRIEGYMCEEGIARFCTVSLVLIVLVKLQKTRWHEHEKYVYALNKLQFK